MQTNKERNPDRFSSSNSPKSTSRSKRIWLWILILVAAFLILRAIGVKISAHREAVQAAEKSAYPVVQTIHPKVSHKDDQLVLPGTVQAFSDTPIFARTSGYVKYWLVDIGARVRNGQLLAEIESPELDQALNQAIGNVQRAQANTDLARITTARWKQMLARDTVSRQESDEKEGNFEAQIANLAASQAAVDRLKELKNFERIYAAFDGVITARNVNIGDLITANNTTQKEMFRIADDSQLRIYVNVPENSASFIKVGESAKVTLASSPGVIALGHVVNIASAIDPDSRTMLTEVRVDNTNHKFLSGGYATVSFDLKFSAPSLILPVNTLLFRPEGTFVGVVEKDNRVSLRQIQIGRDYGKTLEITQGVTPADRVILNPSDSLQNGNRVQVDNKNTIK